jgi:hypothetical protein
MLQESLANYRRKGITLQRKFVVEPKRYLFLPAESSELL